MNVEEWLTTRPDVGSGVVQILGEVIGRAATEISPAASLLELGAQSLDFAEVVFRLERTYRIRIERKYAITSSRTVDDYVRVVADAMMRDQGSTGR